MKHEVTMMQLTLMMAMCCTTDSQPSQENTWQSTRAPMRWLTSSLQSFNVYLLVSLEISNRVTWIKLKKWVCWEFCCTSCWGYFPEWATYATVLEIAPYCNFLGQRLLYCTTQYLLPNNQPIPRHLRCHVIHPLWWRRSLTRHTTKGCTFQTCPSNTLLLHDPTMPRFHVFLKCKYVSDNCLDDST